MELNHINVWLLEDGDGWLLVDTGMAQDVCREAWLRARAARARRPAAAPHLRHPRPPRPHGARALARGRATARRCGCRSTRTARAGEFLRTEPAVLEAASRAFLRRARRGGGARAAGRPRGDHRAWFGGWPPLGARPCDGDVVEAGGGRWQVDRDRRSLPRAPVPARRGARPAGERRPGAADHLAERERAVLGARRRPAARVPRLARAAAARAHPDTLVLPSHGRPFRGLHARLADLAGASPPAARRAARLLRRAAHGLRGAARPCSAACRAASTGCWRSARRSRTSTTCAARAGAPASGAPVASGSRAASPGRCPRPCPLGYP